MPSAALEGFHVMRGFLDRYEFLVLPTVQVPPFPSTRPMSPRSMSEAGNYME